MLKADTVQIVIKSFMMYYFLSSVILFITFIVANRARKLEKERIRFVTIYTFYWIVSVVLAFLPLAILDKYASEPYFSINFFTFLFLLLIIFSIVILKTDKDTNHLSKKVIFSVVILNLFVSLFYWVICISCSRYQYLYSDKDELFQNMTKLLKPDPKNDKSSPLSLLSTSIRHEYDMGENFKEFSRNCVVNLPKFATKKELADYAKEQIKKIKWDWPAYIDPSKKDENNEYKNQAMEAFNAAMDRIEDLTKDEFEHNVCGAYYTFLTTRKNAFLSTRKIASSKHGEGSDDPQKSSSSKPDINPTV